MGSGSDYHLKKLVLGKTHQEMNTYQAQHVSIYKNQSL